MNAKLTPNSMHPLWLSPPVRQAGIRASPGNKDLVLSPTLASAINSIRQLTTRRKREWQTSTVNWMGHFGVKGSADAATRMNTTPRRYWWSKV